MKPATSASGRDRPVKPGNTRVTGKEQYFTPVETANAVVATLATMVAGFTEATVLEPAGGTGAFVEAARHHGARRVISFDIEPRHPLVTRGDFLAQRLDVRHALTVSNPPFGRNNALAIPFFNHAAEVSDVIAFIVPRSWRKWSVQNRLDTRFHLVRDDDLHVDYVDDCGERLAAKSLLRTCVQYWRRGDQRRPLVDVEDRGVLRRADPERADVAITMFGFGCGTVRTDFPRRANTTQLFATLHHPRALEALRAVDFSRFYLHTAYTEALSLKEINFLVNEYLFGDPFVRLTTR